MIIRILDRQGDWLAKRATPQIQRRIGILCCWISTPLFVIGFFVNEPFLVYQMSAGALFIGGISTVVAALPTEQAD